MCVQAHRTGWDGLAKLGESIECEEAPRRTFRFLKLLARTPLRDKKMVRIIKRKAEPTVRIPESNTVETQSITATINDWIDESKQNRIDSETSSRKTIAGWAAEPKI